MQSLHRRSIGFRPTLAFSLRRTRPFRCAMDQGHRYETPGERTEAAEVSMRADLARGFPAKSAQAGAADRIVEREPTTTTCSRPSFFFFFFSFLLTCFLSLSLSQYQVACDEKHKLLRERSNAMRTLVRLCTPSTDKVRMLLFFFLSFFFSSRG